MLRIQVSEDHFVALDKDCSRILLRADGQVNLYIREHSSVRITVLLWLKFSEDHCAAVVKDC